MTPIAPLGIAYLAAVLKKHGFSVRIEDQFESGISPRGIAERVRNDGVDIVGFSLLTPNLPAVTSCVRALREASPAVRIVFGNIHATVYRKELVEKNACDFALAGEGEYSFLELLRVLERGNRDFRSVPGLAWKNGESLVLNPPGEQIARLDDLPFPDWDDLRLSRYLAPPTLLKRRVVLPVIYARGCRWKCRFCAQNVHYPAVRRRSFDNLFAEIERNIERYGVYDFGFQDGSFPSNEKEALTFSEGMVRRDLHRHCRWLTEARVDRMSFDALAAMKEAGLYLIMYGFECGDDAVLGRHGKSQSADDSRRAMEWTRRLGIFTYGLFMLGLPGETEESMEKTVRLALELDPEIAKFNRFVPYPGSPLFHELGYCDRFLSTPESMSPWSPESGGGDPCYVPEGITSDRLREIQRNAVLRFYLRPSKIARMLRICSLQPRNLWVQFSSMSELVAEAFRCRAKVFFSRARNSPRLEGR
jgi:radical SAM superfamily enzyme YgiQ (UPF0313 family)